MVQRSDRAPLGSFGRCLLASSHAGTRLPIAALQNSGRSPSVRHKCGWRSSFPKKALRQKQETSRADTSCKKSWYDFLRRHYPHQVIGSKLDDFLSARKYKLPCFWFRWHYTSVSCKKQEDSEKSAITFIVGWVKRIAREGWAAKYSRKRCCLIKRQPQKMWKITTAGTWNVSAVGLSYWCETKT